MGTAATAPRHARRQQRAAYYRLIRRESLARVARRFRVSPRTIQRWIKLALSRDDDVSPMLRAFKESLP